MIGELKHTGWKFAFRGDHEKTIGMKTKCGIVNYMRYRYRFI